MQPIIHKITVDISGKPKYKQKVLPLNLVRDDNLLNIFEISVKDDGTDVALSDITRATVTFLKDDGNPVIGDAVVDNVNNVLTYAFQGNELSFPGNVLFTVELYKNGGRQTSGQIKFKVVADLDNGSGIPSTPEYAVLTQLINDTQASKDAADEAATAANAASQATQQAISSADEATADANNAAGSANSAAINANNAAAMANSAATNANNAATAANVATTAANTAALSADNASQSANNAADNANGAATSANNAATAANAAAVNTNTVISTANQAAENANNAANEANAAATSVYNAIYNVNGNLTEQTLYIFGLVPIDGGTFFDVTTDFVMDGGQY
jgi:hypothetical protein